MIDSLGTTYKERAQSAESKVLRLEEELKKTQECAYKYLSWLGVKDPEKGLGKDWKNPEMLVPFNICVCGDEKPRRGKKK